jgi:hypothetical protein
LTSLRSDIGGNPLQRLNSNLLVDRTSLTILFVLSMLTYCMTCLKVRGGAVPARYVRMQHAVCPWSPLQCVCIRVAAMRTATATRPTSHARAFRHTRLIHFLRTTRHAKVGLCSTHMCC